MAVSWSQAEMMTSSTPLNSNVHCLDLATEVKRSIINDLWGQRYKVQDFVQIVSRTESYFRYYQTQCELVRHGNECYSHTHRDIIQTVQLLQAKTETREDIKISLRKELHQPGPGRDDIEDEISNSIDLAVRLWLMVNVGDFRRILMPGRSLQWTEGCLRDFMMVKFSQQKVLTEHVKLEKLFNAYSLSRIAGIEIVSTSNLGDHLRMQDDDTRVAVFHHPFFLENMGDCDMFPPGLILETQRSLPLFFPQYDIASSKWLQRQQSLLHLDSKILECGQLSSEDRQIDWFEYWHDRLVVLKQLFDDAEPRSLLQWWRDRRRPAQWYNFWFAVALVVGLTLLFGLVQSIEGGFQAYKAYHK